MSIIKYVHIFRKIILSLEFHQLVNNYQVSQTIKDTHSYLREMMKTISVKDNVLIDLQIIGDFSYAWYHIDRFTGVMQNAIKKEPSFVIKLRATFLKVLNIYHLDILQTLFYSLYLKKHLASVRYLIFLYLGFKMFTLASFN